ncbi:radical SAM protein [Caproicibacter fermentans]|uniref:Radical SAM protein n=1 Tax=Caproicibacter fermentans TaxID=2576756 RepID=A0A7G8TB45_9FIRM|nr:radical SAM protein [Caproicibacter fermentans]QNK40836.1 radical SAM protein [Caproicibacter fermentans]
MNHLHGSIIVTYRCNAHCSMCGCYADPTKKSDEISPDLIRKLPRMKFANITGGEPFLRDDLDEIVSELDRKADRIVISTNGYFHQKILALCRKYPRLGIRISIEGMPKTNDAIRGIRDGFDHGLRCLLELIAAGHRDVGFGMTVQDGNADDLLLLYELACDMKMEFATAALHNSFYFRKTDNAIADKYHTALQFEKLINELLKSNSPKKWFRAYFNHGLINYIYGNPRLLPCEMGSNGFFLDPFGDVLPCNGMDCKMPMGNLKNQSWEEIWNSAEAEKVRRAVRCCPKNCWMIGSVSPAMKQHFSVPVGWVARHKLLKRGYSLKENGFIRENPDDENGIQSDTAGLLRE